MPRYKILIEYDGTEYNGWQRQPKGRTVEAEIEAALAQILRRPVDIIGQGRTDSGVHAEGQAAHFDFPEELDRDRLLHGLLGVLPRDVTVWNMEEVEDDFHARFHATGRQYRFQIVTRRSPLLERHAEMILEDLDLKVMDHCARVILGTHDFESFTKSNSEQENTRCTVRFSEFTRQDHKITYRIKANRFLRHMVRRLVGTITQVGQGQRTVDNFEFLLHNPSKEESGHGAAAKGLILEAVEY